MSSIEATVVTPLRDFGWSGGSVVDLRGIRSARGPQHYLLLFAALMQALRTPAFNVRLVQGVRACSRSRPSV